MTHTHAAVCLLKSCYQCVQVGACLGAWFRVNEVETAAEVGLYCTHNATVHCLLGFIFRKVMQKQVRWEDKASSDFVLSQ